MISESHKPEFQRRGITPRVIPGTSLCESVLTYRFVNGQKDDDDDTSGV